MYGNVFQALSRRDGERTYLLCDWKHAETRKRGLSVFGVDKSGLHKRREKGQGVRIGEVSRPADKGCADFTV